MTVRHFSKVTISLELFFIFIILFFWKLELEAPWKMYQSLLRRMRLYGIVGLFHFSVLKAVVCLLFLAGIIETIFKDRKGFQILLSMPLPGIMGVLVAAFIYIPVNVEWYWIVYIISIVVTGWEYNRIVKIWYPDGKNIFRFIKEIPVELGKISTGTIDRAVLYGTSFLLMLCFCILSLSFVVLCVRNWEILIN